MNSSTDITANLYAFYSEIAQHGKLRQGTIAGIPWIGSPSGGWPAYLLGGANPDPGTVKEIVDAMRDKRIPAFWIMESDPSGDTEKLLSQQGIRMVNYWTGMYMEPSALKDTVADKSDNILPAGSDKLHASASDKISASDPDDNVPAGSVDMHAAAVANTVPPESGAGLQAERHWEIRKISSEREMDQWVELVNRVVMTSSQLDREIFRKLLQFDAFFFYGLWSGDEILSTTLIFVHDQSGGLYFIATDPAHQGKGYGRAITSHAITKVQNAGAKRFVLHSTRQGRRLYRGMGFHEVNRYDIYWLLGKR